MGFWKQAQIERWDRIEANRDPAEEILVRAGLLQRCGFCQQAFDCEMVVHAKSDLTSAYMIASAMFRDGDPLIEGHERQEVLDTIKDIASDCQCECACIRRRDD